VNAIAAADATRNIAIQPDYSPYFDYAAPQAATHDLQMLELVAPDGAIVSSAEWPARFGYKEDWLLSGEYILSQGNRGVILCERGIKTFEDSIRYSLDITSIPVARQWSHLPIIVDPSHAAGKRDYVNALALSGMGAGAHGIIVEVHYNPAEAQCDGPQALLPDMFKDLMVQLRQIAAVWKREFADIAEPVNA